MSAQWAEETPRPLPDSGHSLDVSDCNPHLVFVHFSNGPFSIQNGD